MTTQDLQTLWDNSTPHQQLAFFRLTELFCTKANSLPPPSELLPFLAETRDFSLRNAIFDKYYLGTPAVYRFFVDNKPVKVDWPNAVTPYSFFYYNCRCYYVLHYTYNAINNTYSLHLFSPKSLSESDIHDEKKDIAK